MGPRSDKLGLSQQIAEAISGGECLNCLIEVAVSLGLFREMSPDQGEKSSKIEEVNPPKRGRGEGKFENEASPFRFQDPVHLFERLERVGEIADSK